MLIDKLIQETAEALKQKDPERFKTMTDEELKKYSYEASKYLFEKLLTSKNREVKKMLKSIKEIRVN